MELGSENVDVRIGGTYALERIAKNSAADRNAIEFLLGLLSVTTRVGLPTLWTIRSTIYAVDSVLCC